MSRNKSSNFIIGVVCVLMLFLAVRVTKAETWSFDMVNNGQNQFTPRGYIISTENGAFYLSSRFDNSTGNVFYSGTLNGLSYVDAEKIHTVYAFFDRNPRVYNYLIAYQNGVPIADFSQYVGAPGRLDIDNRLGSGANWAAPINGFEFLPGTLYEFAFLRGLQANNGVTLVFSEDGMGYIRNPSTLAEIAKYESDRYNEYGFISSYWSVRNAQGEAVYRYNMVPMRFSIQTYADVSMWREAAEEAAAFLETITWEQVDEGLYWQANLDNLTLLLAEQEGRIERVIKRHLQQNAEGNMRLMIEELELALSHAKSPEPIESDMSVLREALLDAIALYEKAVKKLGNGVGEYSERLTLALKAVIDEASVLSETAPQAEINDMINELKNAQILLLSAVIRKPQLIFSHEESGVYVMLDESSVPEGTYLYVGTARGNMPLPSVVDDFFRESFETVCFYDIRFYCGDELVEPTSEFEVQIHMPEQMKDKGVAVYDAGVSPPVRVGSAGALDYRLFNAETAGVFALASRPSTSDAAGSPPDDEETLPGDDESSAEPLTITFTEESEIELEKDPYRTRVEFAEIPGSESVVDKTKISNELIDHQLPDEVVFSLDGLGKKGDPIPLLLGALSLALLSVVISGRRILRKVFDRIWR